MARTVNNEEFKRAEALRLIKAGVSHRDTCKKLHIASRTLTRWAQAAKFEWRKKPKSENLTPAPYARGYRWTNTRWM